MQFLEELNALYQNDHWGNRLGIEIHELVEGAIRLQLPFRQENMNLGGRMHGGVLASLLVDSAKLLAQSFCLSSDDLDWRILDFQINYLSAGGPEPLEATAKITRKTKEFLFCRCQVINPANKVLAVADVLVRIYSPLAAAKASIHQQDLAERPLLTAQDIADNGSNKHIVDVFNQMMSKLYPGSSVHYMEDGHAEMIQKDFAEQYDYRGHIAAGQLLLFFDNVSGCSGGSLAEEMGMAVTLTIQSTFCEPAVGENLIGVSKAFYREEGITHNDVKIYGENSRRLKMFGTMTHLARPFQKR